MVREPVMSQRAMQLMDELLADDPAGAGNRKRSGSRATKNSSSSYSTNSFGRC